jgi:hypothetical protein
MHCPGCDALIADTADECPFCHTSLRQPEAEAPADNGIVVLYQEDRVAGELTPAPARPGPHALPAWPLIGLACASVIVFVIISVLLSGLLTGGSHSVAVAPGTSGATQLVPTQTRAPIGIISTATKPTAIVVIQRQPTTTVTLTAVPHKPTAVPPTPTVPPTPVLISAVNCGGGASGDYMGDTGFSGGSTFGVGDAVDTSAVTAPAPQSVYQTERWGTFTYTFIGLTPNATYLVRLHFAEIYWFGAGQRIFSVAINDRQVLTNFDIFSAAGDRDKAIAQSFTTTADSQGRIVIDFIQGPVDWPKCSGIELFAVRNAGG